MIVCLRVDERLIHGQVAMTWTKELKLNGLVVASDEAASNEIQKMTLKMAVPEGIKCIIKSVEDVTTDELEALKELTELYPDTFFQGTPAMEKKMASAILKGC